MHLVGLYVFGWVLLLRYYFFSLCHAGSHHCMGTFPMYIRCAVLNLVCAVTTYFCVEAFYWQRAVHVNNMPVSFFVAHCEQEAPCLQAR
jgi:hypothetical protein